MTSPQGVLQDRVSLVSPQPFSYGSEVAVAECPVMHHDKWQAAVSSHAAGSIIVTFNRKPVVGEVFVVMSGAKPLGEAFEQWAVRADELEAAAEEAEEQARELLSNGNGGGSSRKDV